MFFPWLSYQEIEKKEFQLCQGEAPHQINVLGEVPMANGLTMFHFGNSSMRRLTILCAPRGLSPRWVDGKMWHCVYLNHLGGRDDRVQTYPISVGLRILPLKM